MKMIRLALAALVLSALPAHAAPLAPSSVERGPSIEAAQPASVPAPAPNTKMFTLTAIGMAVGATASTKSSKPSADQIMQANARGLTVVSRTGEGEPDAEDYTVALATGSSTPNPVLAAAAQRANAPQPGVGKSLGELAMMTDDELKAEADSRGIKVVSSTQTMNEAGEAEPSPVSRADYIKALSSGPSSGKFDETVTGGKYKNASGQWVNAHGQKINEDGTMKDPNERPLTGAGPTY